MIEKVTGGSYYGYIAEHVFKPAGMTKSGFPDRDHLQGVAVGYTHFFGDEPKLVPNTDVLHWRGASAGGGVSTANDMLHFLIAMNNGLLLPPKMFKLATTAGATSWYGMGLWSIPSSKVGATAETPMAWTLPPIISERSILISSALPPATWSATT